jgi:hypothetical protein
MRVELIPSMLAKLLYSFPLIEHNKAGSIFSQVLLAWVINIVLEIFKSA